jgi:hypothetical protein
LSQINFPRISLRKKISVIRHHDSFFFSNHTEILAGLSEQGEPKAITNFATFDATSSFKHLSVTLVNCFSDMDEEFVVGEDGED